MTDNTNKPKFTVLSGGQADDFAAIARAIDRYELRITGAISSGRRKGMRVIEGGAAQARDN